MGLILPIGATGSVLGSGAGAAAAIGSGFGCISCARFLAASAAIAHGRPKRAGAPAPVPIAGGFHGIGIWCMPAGMYWATCPTHGAPMVPYPVLAVRGEFQLNTPQTIAMKGTGGQIPVSLPGSYCRAHQLARNFQLVVFYPLAFSALL